MVPENAGGSLNPNDLATLSLLGGGYGRVGVGSGYGGGSLYTGNNVLAAEAHANGTATKEAIDCNSKLGNQGMDHISQQFENATRDRQIAELSREHVDFERRLSDSVAAITAQTNDFRAEAAKCCCETQKSIAEAAKEAAKCCCEAKLQACKDNAELKALVIQENAATRELIRGDALAAANAKITQLETINALSGNGHGGH